MADKFTCVHKCHTQFMPSVVYTLQIIMVIIVRGMCIGRGTPAVIAYIIINQALVNKIANSKYS